MSRALDPGQQLAQRKKQAELDKQMFALTGACLLLHTLA